MSGKRNGWENIIFRRKIFRAKKLFIGCENDHVINICEIKFYGALLTLDKATAMYYRNKMAAFKAASDTRKQVFLTLITTFGVKQNEHSLGLTDSFVTMDDLFEKG